jgi:hypothetical protein
LALLAAYLDLNPGSQDANDTLFTVLPLRLDYLGPLTQRRAGPLRWLAPPNQRILAVVPEDMPNSSAVLGRMADEARVDSGGVPSAILLYHYQIEPKDRWLAIRRSAEVSGPGLYTAAAGY